MKGVGNSLVAENKTGVLQNQALNDEQHKTNKTETNEIVELFLRAIIQSKGSEGCMSVAEVQLDKDLKYGYSPKEVS